MLLVLRLDEGNTGELEEGEFVAEQEDQQDHFVEQGKLLSKLAPSHALHIMGTTKIWLKEIVFKRKSFIKCMKMFCHPISYLYRLAM